MDAVRFVVSDVFLVAVMETKLADHNLPKQHSKPMGTLN